MSAAPQTALASSGVRTLRLSAAFPRIRNNTKIYNTHMVAVPSPSVLSSYQLAANFTRGGAWAESTDFGIRRASNFLSSSSVLRTESSALDNLSFKRFLATPVHHSHDTHAAAVRASRVTSSLGSSTLGMPSSNEMLASPTLSDSTDRILPTDRAVATQPFADPTSSGYSEEGVLASPRFAGSASSNYSDDLSLRFHTDVSLNPLRSASPSRVSSLPTVITGYGESTDLTAGKGGVSSRVTTASGLLPDAASGLADKIPTGLLSLY